MTADEWEQVKRFFEAAVALPEADREAYVRDGCSEWPTICEQVLELLANHSEISLSATGNSYMSPVLANGELVAGRFRITRFIASGGMGEVYEGYDEWLRLRLALKTLRPELLSDPAALERFKRELLVARKVSHQNVCRVFDFVEHRVPAGPTADEIFTPCFTMELLDGESVAQMLAHARPLGHAEALSLIRQVAAGLQTLHDHGIVHRDLKPSNIMIEPRDGGLARAVVMDFGLAKSDSSEADLFQSAPEFQGGAPYFMAPELLRRARPTIASDIYSFGLLIDEMVTELRAFSSRSMQGLYYQKLWEKPTPPSARSHGLPAHWEPTILRCLEAEPAARFTSVAEVLSALEGDNSDATVKGTPAVASAAERRRLIRRRSVIGALIGAPLVGGAATVAALALQPVNSSIEVFDIENQTKLPDYEYLCRGTTAELMRQLVQLQGVRVFALHAPRSGAPAQRVGRFSLDGMLQAHRGQIRLSMQFSDNDHQGALLWSENFERENLGNPLALQSEIARNTVAALERRVLLGGGTEGEASPGPLYSAAYRVRRWLAFQTSGALPGPPTTSNAAFDLYMRGHNLLEEVSPSTASAAIDYFKRAIQEDPRFALAYSSAADAYIAMMNYNYAPHPVMAQYARTYAWRGVELDRNLAEAHAVLGAIRQMDWDWKGAEESYRRALALKPSLARARRWHAGLILQFGLFDEALAEARAALDLDPYDRSAPPAIGLYLFLAGKLREAANMLEQALATKDMLGTRGNLGQVYAWLGHTGSAAEAHTHFQGALQQAEEIERVERATSPGGRTSFADQLYALTYSLMGDAGSAQPFLERLERDMSAGGTSPVTIAWVLAIQERRDEACDLLDRAASWRDRRLLYSKIIPFLANLHGYPRFESLLRQMNLA
jgi:TolB-like protein/tetratricopeptide (TPR) repeat protein